MPKVNQLLWMKLLPAQRALCLEEGKRTRAFKMVRLTGWISIILESSAVRMCGCSAMDWEFDSPLGFLKRDCTQWSIEAPFQLCRLFKIIFFHLYVIQLFFPFLYVIQASLYYLHFQQCCILLNVVLGYFLHQKDLVVIKGSSREIQDTLKTSLWWATLPTCSNPDFPREHRSEPLDLHLTDTPPLSYGCKKSTRLELNSQQRALAVVLNLCYSDAFELQLPETPVSTACGEGFWELQSKTPE